MKTITIEQAFQKRKEEDLIAKLIKTEEGKKMLAEAMMPPVRKRDGDYPSKQPKSKKK